MLFFQLIRFTISFKILVFKLNLIFYNYQYNILFLNFFQYIYKFYLKISQYKIIFKKILIIFTKNNLIKYNIFMTLIYKFLRLLKFNIFFLFLNFIYKK